MSSGGLLSAVIFVFLVLTITSKQLDYDDMILMVVVDRLAGVNGRGGLTDVDGRGGGVDGPGYKS